MYWLASSLFQVDAGVVGTVERALRGLDHRVNDFRIRRRDGERDAAVGLVRQAFAVDWLISVQCSPLSVDLKMPLPGPPERKVHAWRRKSHMVA